jgi:hypothetical protein
MGHSVLAVPAPALDDVIKERTAWYDASLTTLKMFGVAGSAAATCRLAPPG